MVEFNKAAFRTLAHNKERGLAPFCDWPIRNIDVRSASWSALSGQVDVVAGGPPCQPFSIAGNHRGAQDPRDMWPEAIRAVRETKPRAFLFENVRGLLRATFADYLRDIKQQLSRPTEGLEYVVGHMPVNSADYGAAQQRHRVVIYGFRKDIREVVSPPKPTHSLSRLLWEQWITGDYWREYDLPQPRATEIPKLFNGRIEKLKKGDVPPSAQRWRTVRDALRGLGGPMAQVNHEVRYGARSYPGHTGSTYDFPAKALKAGAHGVPGGENTLRCSNGEVRYFTVREAARLQGLPDEMEFPGSWCENTRQLGNAVPVEMAAVFGAWVRDLCLEGQLEKIAA